MNPIRLYLLFLCTLSIQFLPGGVDGQVHAADDSRLGEVRGVVVDRETQAPLAGVSVSPIGSDRYVTTDASGQFSLPSLPVGTYTLAFQRLGYSPYSKPDIIVRSNRSTGIRVEMGAAVVLLDGITVNAVYFPQSQDNSSGVHNFTSEEIRRAPGSAGDINRILFSLPSVGKVNDLTTNLVVRGGSPAETGYLVDNIEVPNINHYPTQGSSGGALSLLNVDLIQDVEFSTGGLSASYGDRLSGVLDVSLREGNRHEFDGQFDFNMSGAGAVVEGPLGSDKGSWLVSARRSFLDLMIDSSDPTVVVPQFQDVQGKFVYDLSPSHKLTVLGIWGDDHIKGTREQALDEGTTLYGSVDITQTTTGLNWSALWGENGHSATSLAFNTARYNLSSVETNTDSEVLRNGSMERTVQLRNTNSYRFNEAHRLEFGVDAKQIISDFDYHFAEYSDPLGAPTSAMTIDDRVSTPKVGVYARHVWRPVDRLTAALGLRYDYFGYTERWNFSPRISLSYMLGTNTTITASSGTAYQDVPLVLLTQRASNKNLRAPRAYNFTLGVQHLLNESTRLTVDFYDKSYDRFPLDPFQPSMFVVDELMYSGLLFAHDSLVDSGKAYTRGVEVVLQKRMTDKIYGLLAGTYFRSRYRDYDGTWRDRMYDGRYNVSVEGGYKPNHKWEFSFRWIVSGGAPYTPLDIPASKAIGRSVFDQSQINSSRYPSYQSLNVRMDRRFYFSGSNLVVYLSIWNAYAHQNVASYYWNPFEGQQETLNQWPMLPIFGLEYEF